MPTPRSHHAQTQTTPVGRFRPAALLAVAAAFLLVPAGQALAQNPHLELNLIGIEGGGGEVVSNPATGFPGTPEIECNLPEGEGEAQEGVCTNEMEEVGPGTYATGLEIALEEIEPAVFQLKGAPNSEFVEWEIVPVAGTSLGPPCALDADNESCSAVSTGPDAELNAIFACKAGKECVPPAVPLKVIKGGNGDGDLTSEPAGIDCEPGCEEETAQFSEGSMVELTATADGASTFDGWSEVSGNPGTCTGTASPCEITLDAAKEIEAEFNLANRTLTIDEAGSGSGSVSCDGGACAASYPHGAEVTLTAKADFGSSFEGFSGSGCSGTGACTVTLTSDTTVTATFDEEGGGDPTPTPPPPLPATCLTNPLLCQSGTLIASRLAPVKGNMALLRARCVGESGASCAGLAKLFAKLPGGAKKGRKARRADASARRGKRRAKPILMGKTRFALPAGASRVLRVRIANGKAKRLLRRGRALKAQLRGAGIRNRAVVLKPAKKKRNKRAGKRRR